LTEDGLSLERKKLPLLEPIIATDQYHDANRADREVLVKETARASGSDCRRGSFTSGI
jgi:hypothetical protein